MRLSPPHIVAATVAIFALVSCGSSSEDSGSDDEPRLQAAYDVCYAPEDRPDTIAGQVSEALDIADAGETLIIQTKGENDTQGFSDYLCVITELGTSERVQSSIANTTSMMGRQKTEDDGLSYEFTYHPDNGLYVLIAEAE